MKVFDYLYYRIYRFAEAIAIGLSNVAPRAAAVLSFIVVLNSATLFGLLGLGLNKNSLAFYLLYFVLVYYWSFRRFSDREEKERANHLFGDEPGWQSFTGSFAVAIVCVLTVVFLLREAL